MELRQISRQLQQIFGLDITRYNESFLIKTLEKQMKDSLCDSFEDYASYLGKKPGEVALIASAMTTDRETILSYGFDGYIAKPIDQIELNHTIQQVLYGKE